MKNIIIKELNKTNKDEMKILLESEPSEEVLSEYLHRGRCFSLTMGRKTAGLFILYQSSSRQVELYTLSVEKKRRRKGLGSLLLKAAMSEAREMGAFEMVVKTRNSAPHNLNFYQRAGFRIESVEKNYFTQLYGRDIHEGGILCRDAICLTMSLREPFV